MPTLDDAQSALERHFGFSRFREGQSDVIEAVLAGQDVIVARRPRRLVRAMVWSGIAVVALGAVGVLAWSWKDTTHSVSASRLRIATVTRGNLVRDAAVNGRVVAAVSPTIFSPAAGTVTLKVSAGDTVSDSSNMARKSRGASSPISRFPATRISTRRIT